MLSNALKHFGVFVYYIQHCNTRTRLGMSGLTLYSQHCKTSLYRDSYFNILVHLWNALPSTIQTSDKISSFKILLKEFYVERLRQVFDGDNIRTFKLVCPKCGRVNAMSCCSC